MSFTQRKLEELKEFVEMMQSFFWFSVRAFQMIYMTKKYWEDTKKQLYIIGVETLPILFVSGIAIGGLIVMEVGHQMAMFGAKTLTGRATALSIIRETTPILLGVVLISRYGARNSSELGSMKISEQIEALRAFGTDPIAKLVVPRLVASLILYIPLSAINNTVALTIGSVIAYYDLNIDTGIYWNNVIDLLVIGDWVIAIVKPPIFAITTTLITCFSGFNTTGGTAGVGRATIKGIVVALGVLLVLNFFITKIIVETVILP